MARQEQYKNIDDQHRLKESNDHIKREKKKMTTMMTQEWSSLYCSMRSHINILQWMTHTCNKTQTNKITKPKNHTHKYRKVQHKLEKEGDVHLAQKKMAMVTYEHSSLCYFVFAHTQTRQIIKRSRRRRGGRKHTQIKHTNQKEGRNKTREKKTKIIMLQILRSSRPFRWFLVDHEKIVIPPT